MEPKMALLMIVTASLAFLLPSPAAALMPYSRSVLDMMFPPNDPLKILDGQSPLDDNALALARADWRETPAEHQISLDVPGMKREDVRIEVEENRVLRVSGERRSSAEEAKEERWHRVERTVGKFWRQFRLPANADMENVRARLEDGVLKITVPKLVEKEVKKGPRVIDIVADGRAGSTGAAGEDVRPTKKDM